MDGTTKEIGMKDAFEFVRLSPDDWQMVRDLRVRAVTEVPKAFGKTPAEEMAVPESVWRGRLEKKVYTVVQMADKPVGLVSITPEEGEKVRHIASINSVYVAPEARGKGVARELLTQAMYSAKDMHPQILKFNLAVGVTQTEAQELYKSLGFERIGVAKKELFVGGEYIDEIIMEKYL